ncbi:MULTISPECIES: NUDIX hydrolase [Oceanotoga]|jgi:8-oxo-dGTP pyrophosphatase MutT (NUDIX family)|uniref:NUDIX domain-containing protein n=1 Tax=Oceanotoga teriensis TaxID=515440 RepID=A0AA45C757_9BACT|nr:MULTISPECIES: CoA pyrophosphatase [Oceanotoga]MDN5341833.1 hypothetical protein [Oceanotoga sp.]MDO7976686.1 CoA pyrophosphatase [Oceanotoga teriensis]PWJ95207.1 NUDIX domain-containing protein [Oceanotoga teriensis]
MKKNEFINKINNFQSKHLGIKNKYAVLIPLIEINEQLHIIYEIRSKKLKTQPGEVSFPGGKIEKGESPLEATIRETQEELLIKKEDIRIISEGDILISPYNFLLYSYIGIIEKDLRDINPSKDEVDHIFTVPIDYFINEKPQKYIINIDTNTEKNFPYHLIPEGEKYNWRKGIYPVYFYKYKNYIIWGMTARFTKEMIKRIK